ncbi:hypothetical protein KQI48_09940 [Cellulomonas hominis]|uniref:DUF6903 family protein n=1 Tax=Cellulomonas hominis TaxID=156981 RepID=UPI001C0F5F97|nr:hypothetical protein [Cellulomonas hominis]MBU5422984.1 hypothetical protein [Cellulomonas hominis]
MTPERRAVLWTAARFALAAACVALVVVSQRTVGWANLGLMLVGLGGLLALLHSYNRTYR